MTDLVEFVDGVAVVSSKSIADSFGKVHRDVMRAIKNIDCSDDFRVRNFARSSYVSRQGKTLDCYSITRDGFAFLCMGFTGSEAAKWKEAYIRSFNQLETFKRKEDESLSAQINNACKKIDDISAAGSAWGKTGSEIRKAKRKAIENVNKLIDRAQMSLGFDSAL